MTLRKPFRPVQPLILWTEEYLALSKDGAGVLWPLILLLKERGIDRVTEEEIRGHAKMERHECAAGLANLRAHGWLRQERRGGVLILWLHHPLLFEPRIGAKRAAGLLRKLREELPPFRIVVDYLEAHRERLDCCSEWEEVYEHFVHVAPRPDTASDRASDTPSDTPSDRVSDTASDRVSDTPPREHARETGDRRRETGVSKKAVVEVGSHAPHAMTTEDLLDAMCSRFPTMTERDRNQNRAVAVSILAEREPAEIMAAVVGIEQLFPFDAKGKRPWDLRDLNRHFARAVAAAQNHPEVKARDFEQQFLEMTGGGDD